MLVKPELASRVYDGRPSLFDFFLLFFIATLQSFCSNFTRTCWLWPCICGGTSLNAADMHVCFFFSLSFFFFFYKPCLARLKPLLCVCRFVIHVVVILQQVTPQTLCPSLVLNTEVDTRVFRLVCLITVDIIGQKLRFSPLLLCSTPLIPNMVLGKAHTGLKGRGAFLGTGKPPQQSCAVLGKRPIGFFGTSWTLRSLILNAKIWAEVFCLVARHWKRVHGVGVADLVRAWLHLSAWKSSKDSISADRGGHRSID